MNPEQHRSAEGGATPPRFALAGTILFSLLSLPSISAPASKPNPESAMPHTDIYTNYANLAAHEREGADYRIRLKSLPGIAILAPHGGNIEPGTSEIAEAVAGTNFAFYSFDGLLPKDNRRLHITSTRFDERRAMELIATATTVVTIHGEGSTNDVVYIGGCDESLGGRMTTSLREAGFDVRTYPRKDLQGLSRDNICNRGRSGGGVQLELSAGLRRACFASPYPGDRSRTTPRFKALVRAIRSAL